MCSFIIEDTPDSIVLRLDGELTIEHAGSLYKALSAKVASGFPLLIDASRLTRLDASIIQILLEIDPRVLREPILKCSSGWQDSLSRYGVTPASGA